MPRAGALVLSLALGAVTVVFGAGLMATAGYLISRAAERPAILSLTVAIVAVRFFGIGRPIARYLERLASHDLALRSLARVRVQVCRRIEPLAPAGLEGYRSGDLLSRMVADVDAFQNLYLRGVGPPLVALLSGAAIVGVAAAFLPAAGLVLAGGLLLGGVAVPLVASALGRRAARRQAAARGRLAAELVELLDAAPELAVNGAGEARFARVAESDARLVEVARRDALAGGVADGLCLLITGATVCGVLAVAVDATAAGRLDRVLIAMLGAARARLVRGDPAPVGSGARAGSHRRGREPRARAGGPRRPRWWIRRSRRRRPRGRSAWRSRTCGCATRPASGPALDSVSLRLEPGRRIALVGPSGAGKTTVANLLLRFIDPEAGRVTLAGRDLRDYSQEDVRRAIAVAGQDSYLFSTSIYENVRLARPDAADAEIEDALRQAQIWDWIRELPDGLAHPRGRARPRAVGRPAPATSRSPARCWQARRCWCSTSPPRTSTRPPPPS